MVHPLVEGYIRSHNEYDTKQAEIAIQISKKEAKIISLNRQLEKLREKKKKVKPPMPWTEVLRGINDELEAVSGLKMVYSGRTFGLRAETYLALTEPDKDDECRYNDWVYSLVITPDIIWQDDPHKVVDLQFYYDTGEVTEDFPNDTIGAINGMNNKTALLPLNAKEIYEIMKQVSAMKQ